jgi:protein involved in polysaccharide export with SLBB domain
MNGGRQSKMGETTASALRRRRRFTSCFAVLLAVSAGCLSDRASIEKQLLAELPSIEEKDAVAQAYRVYCPDVIDIRVIDRPALHWTGFVDVDGSLPVDELARPRVEGRTTSEISKIVAARLGLDDGKVVVQVADYRSKRVHVFGAVKGSPQAVPYRGPETVPELLQRLGGITTGAEPDKIYVVRPNIAEGKQPELFHVDLRAIILKKDHRTDVRLQPFDQVHVGETPQALVERCIPPWMRPFHWAIWDTRPHDKPPITNLQERLYQARHESQESRADASP